MSKRTEYKEALSAIDKNTRLCLLYLEKRIDDKFKISLETRKRRTELKPDLSKVEIRLDGLQKQIDGLKEKVEEAHKLVQEHEDHELYLKTLANKAEKIMDELKRHFEELYESGYYKEGKKRRIREEGLIK